MRRLSANYIFPGDKPPLKNGIIHVDDDGTILDVIDTGGNLREEASLEFYNGIITPGFVNAHCHLELSHLKGMVPEHTGLEKFLLKINQDRYFETNLIRKRVIEGHSEMLQNGIVAVGDICNTADSFEVKNQDGIYYFSFLEVFGLNPEKADILVQKALDLASIIKRSAPHPHAIVPHAPYTISEVLFKSLSVYATNQIVTIHNQESEGELQLFKNKEGPLLDLLLSMGSYIQNWQPISLNSLDHSLHYLSAARKILLVHNTYSTDDDIRLASNSKPQIFWILCPNANLYIENQLPDVNLLIHRDQNIALGTDSLASNHHLSILEEMKTLQYYFPDIPIQSCIEWGTLNGARALEMDHFLGSIHTGKKPGLNLIYELNLPDLKLTPESKVKKII